MAPSRDSHLVGEILEERRYQEGKWGTAFDNKNTVNDWQAYANIHLAKATDQNATPEQQRTQVLKAATLLIAAVEAFDRNEGFPPRHYDKAKV